MRLATVAVALIAVGSVAAAPIPDNARRDDSAGALDLNATLGRRDKEQEVLNLTHTFGDATTATNPVEKLSNEFDKTDQTAQKLDQLKTVKVKDDDVKQPHVKQPDFEELKDKELEDEKLKVKEPEGKELKHKEDKKNKNWFQKHPYKSMALGTVGAAGLTGAATAIGMDQKGRADLRREHNKYNNLRAGTIAYLESTDNGSILERPDSYYEVMNVIRGKPFGYRDPYVLEAQKAQKQLEAASQHKGPHAVWAAEVVKQP